MERIYTSFFPLDKIRDHISPILEKRYGVSGEVGESQEKNEKSDLELSLEKIDALVSKFNNATYVVLEHPYVDKYYRDTYYAYFATKHKEYHRNSVRLSFFTEAVSKDDFRSPNARKILQAKYRGFVSLRPTFPDLIGRSIISPSILGGEKLFCTLAKYSVTVRGVKLEIEGFPYSSQDGEAITCAETTIWSMMEYFGAKYPDYRPILPFEVINLLGKNSVERMIPSAGLTTGQISFAIKELGFGVRKYSRVAYKEDFDKILRTYVDSGVPVIAYLEDDKEGGAGHVVNVVGRGVVKDGEYEKLQKEGQNIGDDVIVFDNAAIDFECVYVDDNLPPYRVSPLSNPALGYLPEYPDWGGMKIEQLIVPLYPKVYLEAGQARVMSISMIRHHSWIKNKKILIKTYLASARSFKDYISLNETLRVKDKEFSITASELVVSISMPKFIWVTEISTFELVKENKVEGLLVLDATEPKHSKLLLSIMEGTVFIPNGTKIAEFELNLQPFTKFQSGLQ